MFETTKRRFMLPLNLQLFAEGEGAGSGEGGSGEGAGAGSGAGEGSGAGDGKSGGEKTLTEAEAQAKIDAAVKDRLAREKKKNDGILQKLQAQIDELSGKQPAGAGAEGAGADAAAIEAAKAEANKILALANQKVLNATAHTEAVKLGIDPQYAADAVKLADLSKAMSEDGTVDEKAVAKALDDVLKRVPAFKKQDQQGGGFRVGGEGGKGPNGNGWNSGQQQQGGQQPAAGKRWNRWQ